MAKNLHNPKLVIQNENPKKVQLDSPIVRLPEGIVDLSFQMNEEE